MRATDELEEQILSEPEYRIFKKIDEARASVLALREPKEIEAFDRLVSLGYLEQKSNGFYGTLNYPGKMLSNKPEKITDRSTDDGIEYRLFCLELTVSRIIGVLSGFFLAHYIFGPLIFD